MSQKTNTQDNENKETQQLEFAFNEEDFSSDEEYPYEVERPGNGDVLEFVETKLDKINESHARGDSTPPLVCNENQTNNFENYTQNNIHANTRSRF